MKKNICLLACIFQKFVIYLAAIIYLVYGVSQVTSVEQHERFLSHVGILIFVWHFCGFLSLLEKDFLYKSFRWAVSLHIIYLLILFALSIVIWFSPEIPRMSDRVIIFSRNIGAICILSVFSIITATFFVTQEESPFIFQSRR